VAQKLGTKMRVKKNYLISAVFSKDTQRKEFEDKLVDLILSLSFRRSWPLCTRCLECIRWQWFSTTNWTPCSRSTSWTPTREVSVIIGVGKFLGMRKINAPNFPKLARKTFVQHFFGSHKK